MTAILTDRAHLLDSVELAQGAHERTQSAMCAMEAVAYITGEPWSDHPQCVSPVIAAFLRAWNDALSEPPRTALIRPLLRGVIGTRTTDADEETRAWLATDWLVRVHAPAFMDLTPSLASHASALRSLPPLLSSEIALASQQVLNAAWDAAGTAAGAAARDAARDAAGAAARDALQPTVTTLQASAQQLVRDMCAVGRDALPPTFVAAAVGES